MIVEENLDIVRRYIEAWHRVDVDEIARLIAPDFVQHGPGPVTVTSGAAMTAVLESAREDRAFADGAMAKELTIQVIFGSGNVAASSVVAPSRALLAYTGLLASSGENGNVHQQLPYFSDTAVQFVTLYRIERGRIRETWQEASEGIVPSKIRRK